MYSRIIQHLKCVCSICKKKEQKIYQYLLIENSVVFALAIYWSTQQRASLALCSGIPIPNSKKMSFNTPPHAGSFCAYLKSSNQRNCDLIFSLFLGIYLRITDRSVFTRMKDGLAKDDILEMRVNFAFLALVYFYYRKCNEQFDTHTCQFFNCFGIRSVE